MLINLLSLDRYKYNLIYLKEDEKQEKTTCIFKNIKSNFIFGKILGIILEKKKLEIIKYNNTLKNKIKINTDYYKIYPEIEIEIIPNDNIRGKFINIKKEEKKYFHIFFNDNKDEIKRYSTNKNISSIRVLIEPQIKSFEKLFEDCRSIESIIFKKFNRNNIINMNHIFYRCSSLKELNLSNFNTKNVTDMSHMYHECQSLKDLNISNFNTNKVTDTSQMFYECSSLKELNLSNFNTNNVTNMNSMFCWCSSLKEFNRSDFNTNNVTDISHIFSRCSSLKE